MSYDPLTAKIVEWDAQRGYGYLQTESKRLFLHRREFVEMHKRPEVGDVIQYTLGRDAKGRTCAKNAVHVNDGGRLTVLAVLVLAGFLVLPVLALKQMRLDYRWTAAYVVLLNFMTYCAYGLDKMRARDGEWRTPEFRLHLFALLGGWPGAFLAQRRLRHKCSKAGFLFVFWLIVATHQLVALDCLLNWKMSHTIQCYFEKLPQHRR